MDVRSYCESRDGMVRNCADVDEVVRSLDPVSEMDWAWRQSPAFPNPYIAGLSGITLIPGTRLLLDGGIAALSDEIMLGFQHFGFPPKQKKMRVTDGPVLTLSQSLRGGVPISTGIHLTGEHEANYFHWMVEILPRLFLSEELGIERSLPLLVSDGLHENLYQLLDLVRSPGRPVIRLNPHLSYRVDLLVYPSDVSRIFDVYDRAPGLDTTYLPVGLLKAMVTAIKQRIEVSAAQYPKRLFVRRNSSYRLLVNQSEIEDALVSRGFVAVDPEGLSVSEQVALFSQAGTIVGPSGAALANMLWCRENCRVLVLHSDHPFKKYPYWDALARVSGIRITYLSGRRANRVTGRLEAHDDYSIDPGCLIDVLEDR